MNWNSLVFLSLVIVPWACIGKKKNNSNNNAPQTNPPTEKAENGLPNPGNSGSDGNDGNSIPVPSLASARDILFADVNGDGMDDAVAFTDEGVFVALSEGKAQFDSSYTRWTAEIGQIDPNLYPYKLGDVNGDKKSDIILFGNQGVFVFLAEEKAFSKPQLWSSSFGKESQDRAYTDSFYHPRFVADVNGDGIDDIVGCHISGCYGGFSDGAKFLEQKELIRDFSTEADGITSDEGWTNMNLYPRFLGDVNGDGQADIIGFGLRGVWLSLSDGSGFLPKENPSNPGPILDFFATSQGWLNQETHPRLIGDFDGDQLSDVIGIKDGSAFIARGSGSFDTYDTVELSTLTELGSGFNQGGRLSRADTDGNGKDEVVIWLPSGKVILQSI